MKSSYDPLPESFARYSKAMCQCLRSILFPTQMHVIRWKCKCREQCRFSVCLRQTSLFFHRWCFLPSKSPKCRYFWCSCLCPGGVPSPSKLPVSLLIVFSSCPGCVPSPRCYHGVVIYRVSLPLHQVVFPALEVTKVFIFIVFPPPPRWGPCVRNHQSSLFILFPPLARWGSSPSGLPHLVFIVFPFLPWQVLPCGPRSYQSSAVDDGPSLPGWLLPLSELLEDCHLLSNY